MRLFNIFVIMRVLIMRGNWKLIRHSYKQLLSFISCRSGLNKRSPFHALFYWYGLLKGPDMLLWRLETFGFIFPQTTTREQRINLNRYI